MMSRKHKSYFPDKMKISIIGIGAFGYSLTYHLGNKYLKDENITIRAHDSNSKLMEHVRKYRTHLYHFKGKKIPPNILLSEKKSLLVKNADIVILAVTSQSIRGIIKEIKDYLRNGVIIINTAKALEIGTGKIFSEVVKEELTESVTQYHLAKLSGGTFAVDLINSAPLGAEIACENLEILKRLQIVLSSNNLRIYANSDLIGVEYAGAFKNIIAIFAGIIKGLKLPYGSETHMISRAAKESKEIAVKLGAKSHTFSVESQCWGNDLWMSCTGRSRNKEFGMLIGAGLSPKKAIEKMQLENKMVEGYFTTNVIPMLIKKAGIEAPIFNQIYNIIHKNASPSKSIESLMNRQLENIGNAL